MSFGLPQDLNSFLPLLSTSDIRMKVIVGSKLFTFLEEPNNSIECSDIGMFIDGIVQWLSNSNPKVTQYGIEIITQLINRMKAVFKPYISSVLPLAVDRLGDSKEPIKLKAFFLIMTMMECGIISPQALFDKISTNSFNHKNSHVKEGSMNLLLSTVEEYGVNCITISKIIPMVIKLLSDPNVQVRHKAIETLVGLYKNVGEKFRVDLQRKYSIPQSKMIDLMNKFDEAKAVGDLIPNSFAKLSLHNNDETDCTYTLPSRPILGSIKRPGSFPSIASLQQPNSVQNSTSSCHAGAVDEDTFIKCFEDVPTLQIFSIKDLDDTMKKLNESIKNTNEQWSKRVDSLKRIRSLILVGATKYEEFFNNLKYLEHSFQISLKDLRSQVVKETCITIAFLAQRLDIKFSHFSESIFSNLIHLVPNSAKVIASSGLVALRFILEYTHASRIIPLLASSLVSKSKDIRRTCYEFFDQILRVWPIQVLEKHISILQESIKKGIADADSGARMLSRKSFWGFCEHFPEQGEMLLNELEPTYRKVLLNNSGSSKCLPTSVAGFTELSSRRSITSQNKSISMRSSSAIDFLAVQRAKARTEYAALSRQKVKPTVSPLSFANKMNENMYQTDRIERSRGRLSMSQPTSRSCSPSSKFSFGQPRSQRGSPCVPISQNTSRQASPNRSNFLELPSSKKHPVTKSIIKQKILVQNQETEFPMTNALGSTFNKSPNKVFERMFNYQSDENEKPNFVFEHLIDSCRPSSDSFYWNTSQNCLQRNMTYNPSLHIEDIISNCESSCWNDRKEGLISLLTYLQQNNILNKILLKRLTDIFSKMFMDSQTKVISLFLDVLNELIITHCQFLEYWLYTLLVKLFIKEGSDILGSVHSKILKTIDTIQLSFPCDIQFITVFKFLTDPTQTPNAKIKILVMNYISKLAITAHSGSVFVSTVNGRKDYSTLALTKIIGWTVSNDTKDGPELRRAAQKALVALYSLNASQITLRLSQLPEEYQEVVSRLIKFRVRRSSVDQLMSRKYQNITPPTNIALPPLQPDANDTCNLRVTYNSSKQILSDVQCPCPRENVPALYYSKINQMSEHKETKNCSSISYKNGLTVTDGVLKILDDLDKDIMKLDHQKLMLNHLKEMINDCPSDVHIKHFKKIIKVVMKLLMDNEPIVREQTILLITCMVQKPEMITCFDNFTELILMKVLNMCCDSCKSVVKVAEECSIALSISLKPEKIVKIITPLMAAKEFPINLMAIKMMTKLVDVYGSYPIVAQMKEIMHSLLQSYDNRDSAIRKSAVFCLVSLHKVLGEQEFAPHISSLDKAKLKLLNLYIKRAQQFSSTSPFVVELNS